MRIIIESEDEMPVVETRKARSHAGHDEADMPASEFEPAALDEQTVDVGPAPVELRVEPFAGEDGRPELIDIGGFRAR